MKTRRKMSGSEGGHVHSHFAGGIILYPRKGYYEAKVIYRDTRLVLVKNGIKNLKDDSVNGQPACNGLLHLIYQNITVLGYLLWLSPLVLSLYLWLHPVLMNQSYRQPPIPTAKSRYYAGENYSTDLWQPHQTILVQ